MKSSLQQKTKQFMYLDRKWSNIFQFVLIVKINKKNILIIGDHLNIQYCLLRDIINFFVAWQLNLKKKQVQMILTSLVPVPNSSRSNGMAATESMTNQPLT